MDSSVEHDVASAHGEGGAHGGLEVEPLRFAEVHVPVG